ncbi:hypothetical protein GEMRC1_008986 [Eukaryota sp. GEM-RC1]
MNPFQQGTASGRPLTSRQGLGSRGLSTPLTGRGVASLRTANVQHRPVTSSQHGLVGVSTSAGNSRQVYDRNCVLEELNKRIKETAEEISSTRNKISSITSAIQKKTPLEERKSNSPKN